MTITTGSQKPFFSSRTLWLVALVALLVAGLGIRLYDLTDLPLDFHPTRQLMSAIKARGMYYQDLAAAEDWKQDFAVQEWKTRAHVEPEAFERLVALTYRATGENLWVARVYSSLFWTLGAFFLFLLARQLVPVDGALVTTALYLFLPYSVPASRSFQPDPLMVLLTIVYWWALARWATTVWSHDSLGRPERDARLPGRVRPASAWVFAAVAGVAGGLAIFVKLVAAFFVIAAAAAIILGREPLGRTARRPQVWLMITLGILPAAAYLAYGIWFAGYLGQQFEGRFFPALFLSPSYYAGWAGIVLSVVGSGAVMLGLAGILLAESRLTARFLTGLWLAYALYGLYFNYHISTHDYYSLILIPIVSLSIGPVGAGLLSQLAGRLEKPHGRRLALAVMGIGLLLTVLGPRSQLSRIDYRPEADMWLEIGNRLGPDARVLALTQDYGMRLSYWGWLAASAWPSTADLRYHALRGADPRFESEFDRLARNRDYFLVTDFDELRRQPALEAKLAEFGVVAKTNRYVILDLAADDVQ